MKNDEMQVVENVNVPGHTGRVNAAMYQEMKSALLQILPDQSPGLTHKQIMTAILPVLSEQLFPEGKKRGWWSKTVQLDLEAKQVIVRENSKPLRWYQLTQ